MYIEYNVNPADKKVGDCVIRALTKALGMTWEEVYLALCLQGYKRISARNIRRVCMSSARGRTL